MSNSSDATIHHEDIYGYYQALQNFFHVSEVKHDRSNSPRAQKARAKLLKLSASQFYELSTDVYDELQRRLNTDPGQPDYLLPKAGFHIKRNQARQKLANLSQTRFNDLVDDILFEIKRRGYDVNPNAAEEVDRPYYQEEQHAYDRSFLDSIGPSNGNTINTSDGSIVQAPASATIQASQVIPKKASIDWSSEEDDDEKQDKQPFGGETAGGEEQVSNKAVSVISEKNDLSSSPFHLGNPSTPVLKSFADDYHYSDLHDTPASVRAEGSAKKTVEVSKSPVNTTPRESNKGGLSGITQPVTNGLLLRNIKNSVPELAQKSAEAKQDESITSSTTGIGLTRGITDSNEKEKARVAETTSQVQSDTLREANERLTEKLTQKDAEIGKLKEEIAKLESAAVSSKGAGNLSASTSLQEELTSLSSQVSSLSIDNEKLKQQISELEFKAKHVSINRVDQQPQLIGNTQNTYSLDPQSISRYISKEASVPFELIKDIYNRINSLLVRVQSGKDDDGKKLFEILSHLSGSIHQMLILVDVPQFKDEVILLKASLSHALTAVRYHAVYHSILPKITVVAALSELAFAICNLVESCKIKPEGLTVETAHSNASNETDKNVAAQAPHTPIEPAYGSMLSQQPLTKPTDVLTAAEDTTDEMSPVKPLKITQRANLSPGSNLKPSTSRKTSGSLLFSSMIETKSPLSTSSSKVHVKQPQGLTDGSKEEKPKKPVRFDTSTKNGPNPSAKQTPQSQGSQLTTPTKSVNNAALNVVDGTPSLPTPVAHTSSPQKHENGGELPKSEVKERVNESTPEPARSLVATEAKVGSLNKSFAEKLKTFANNTGIGLRVEKEPKTKPNTKPEPIVKQVAVQVNTPERETPINDHTPKNKEDTEDRQIESSSKKVNYSPLRPPEVNPTPSKLSEKFKKTFDDMSDNDTEDDSRSDLNDSSNFSDDGSTYMALKQSLRQNDSDKQEARTIRKATVYSPRAQQNSQFNDSETRFGSDTDLSDIPTDYSQEQKELNGKKASEGFLSKEVHKIEPEASKESSSSHKLDLSQESPAHKEPSSSIKLDLSQEPRAAKESSSSHKLDLNQEPRAAKESPELKFDSKNGSQATKDLNIHKLASNKEKDYSFNEPSFDTDLNASPIKKEDLDESSDYQFMPLKNKDVHETKASEVYRKPIEAAAPQVRSKHIDANPTEVPNAQTGLQEEEDDDVDFDFDAFDIENPDNTLSELLLYLEHQTVQVISTIQSLLTSIKQPQATKGDLRKESNAINQVIRQMVDATSISMNQSRNASLKEHGSWVVKSLEDCSLRMVTLCQLNVEGTLTDIKKDADFADKHFKQRLAGIAFDVAKCTKELVKTVEEASLKEEIAFLNSRLN